MLQKELKQNAFYKQKFKQLQKENSETTKKYIESQSLRKQQEGLIELQHRKIEQYIQKNKKVNAENKSLFDTI